MTVGCVPILPTKKFNPNTLIRSIRHGVQLTADFTQKEFNKTKRTWKTHHPKFTKEVAVTQNAVTFTVMTDDLIYFFLNYGTDFRMAHMSYDWASKTGPWIGSLPGRGKVIYIGNPPRPGIDARNWDQLIADELVQGEIFFDLVNTQLRYAIIRMGYEI